MNRYIIPLLVFLVLVSFLAVGLRLDPKKVPSPFIDKPTPAFKVPQLHDSLTTISNEDMRGKVWLLNVFASWCVACRQEHPLLNALAKKDLIEIIGLNYKDESIDAKNWLQALGDPYDAIAFDYDGNVGIDYGVYGVPESFLVDKKGVIRHKQIGPFDANSFKNTLLPMIEQLNAEG